MALSKFARARRRLAAGLTAQQPAWRDPDPKPRYDAIIIGGGGHGLATAYYLAKVHRMRHTVVLERGWLGETCWQLPVVYGRGPDLPETAALYRNATDKFADLAGELGFLPGLSGRGVLEFAEHGKGSAALHYAANLHRLVGGDARSLDRNETITKAPLLASVTTPEERRMEGVLYPGGGLGQAEQLIWAYARAAADLGVDIVQDCELTSFVLDGRKIAGVETSRGSIEAPVVAICAEAYAGEIGSTAGFRLPVQTRSIEVVATEPLAPALDPVVISRSSGVAAAQMASGEIVFRGAAGDYASASPWGSGRQIDRLLSDAAKLLPKLGGVTVTQRWSAPVDVTPDGQPIIGRAPVDGMFLNCGWGQAGYAALPMSGILFAELLGRFTTNDLIAPFSLGRFAAGAALHTPMVPAAMHVAGAPCF